MTKQEQRIQERAHELWLQNGEWGMRKALAVAIKEEEQKRKWREERKKARNVSFRPVGWLDV